MCFALPPVAERMSRAKVGPMVVSLDGAHIRAIAGAQVRHFEVTVGRVDTQNTPARHFAPVLLVRQSSLRFGSDGSLALPPTALAVLCMPAEGCAAKARGNSALTDLVNSAGRSIGGDSVRQQPRGSPYSGATAAPVSGQYCAPSAAGRDAAIGHSGTAAGTPTMTGPLHADFVRQHNEAPRVVDPMAMMLMRFFGRRR